MDVGPLTVNVVAAVPPKLTAVAPLKFVPVIVTLVPPALGPEAGFTLVIAGAGVAVGVGVPAPEVGARSTPRKYVFAGAVARTVAVLAEPVSITEIRLF